MKKSTTKIINNTQNGGRFSACDAHDTMPSSFLSARAHRHGARYDLRCVHTMVPHRHPCVVDTKRDTCLAVINVCWQPSTTEISSNLSLKKIQHSKGYGMLIQYRLLFSNLQKYGRCGVLRITMVVQRKTTPVPNE